MDRTGKDILEGNSDTQGAAPLTQAQTVAICRHLQNEIREVQIKASENGRVLQHTGEEVRELKDKSVATHEEIHSLQLGMAEVNNNFNGMLREFERMFEAVRQLQNDDQTAKEKITQMEENKKMTDTRLDEISKDLRHENATGKTLRQVIEKRINEDMRIVISDMANTKLQLDHLRQDLSLTQEAEKEDRDSLKQAHANIENVLNEVKKSNTVINIIENRLASTAKGVQANWEKISDFGGSLVKLTECYETTKERIIDTEGTIKEISEAGKKTNHGLDALGRQVHLTSDRVNQAIKVLEENGGFQEASRNILSGQESRISAILRRRPQKGSNGDRWQRAFCFAVFHADHLVLE